MEKDKKAIVRTDRSGKVQSLDWETESGRWEYSLSKRRIAVKMAELIVLGYSISTLIG